MSGAGSAAVTAAVGVTSEALAPASVGEVRLDGAEVVWPWGCNSAIVRDFAASACSNELAATAAFVWLEVMAGPAFGCAGASAGGVEVLTVLGSDGLLTDTDPDFASGAGVAIDACVAGAAGG